MLKSGHFGKNLPPRLLFPYKSDSYNTGSSFGRLYGIRFPAILIFLFSKFIKNLSEKYHFLLDILPGRIQNDMSAIRVEGRGGDRGKPEKIFIFTIYF
jgi:hypothetical protein